MRAGVADAEQVELSIVVPNYNDRDSIVPFIDETIAILATRPDYHYEIIVVDDGSQDGSQLVLQRIAAERPQVRLVELVRNFGQQGALYVGLTYARGAIVVTIDGDGQYPPSSILTLADAIRDGHDMASGIRQSRQDDWLGRVSSRAGGYLIRNVLGFQISDFGAVKAFSRPLVERIVAVQLGSPEVYSAALSWRPNLKECPIEHRERARGASKWSLVQRVKLYFDLYFKYADDRFGWVLKGGLLLMLLSVAGVLLLLLYKLILGHQESVFLILAVGAMFFVLGLQLVLWSLTGAALKQILRQGSISPDHMVRRHPPVLSPMAEDRVR
jgi:undecaprenyl-phosphate 4-deoxy-4-formamido-L-arabinose transferase